MEASELLGIEHQVIADVQGQGWDREAERHRRIAMRISELLRGTGLAGQTSPGMNGVFW